jgi:hypothetical protein
LSTLAAGYAETGDFDQAIEWSKKAVEIGEEAMKPALQKELDSYLAGKPWREASLESPAAEPPPTEVAPPAPDEDPLE